MREILREYYYVPIIDVGIKVGKGRPYVVGRERDVFSKTPKG